jgi:hypothetical protein
VGSATPELGDTLQIDVTVEGFDSLSSAQFRLKWDQTVIRLIDSEIPVDSFTSNSPFNSNPDPDRITFLYFNEEGTGIDGSLRDGSTLLRLNFVAIGASGDSTCINLDSSIGEEFIKLASEELDVTLKEGCVHLQGVNSTQSQEQQNLTCYWQSNDRLILGHPLSSFPAKVEVFTLDGRELKNQVIAPQTITTPIYLSRDWQRTLIAVRYSRNGFSYTRLIAGNR